MHLVKVQKIMKIPLFIRPFLWDVDPATLQKTKHQNFIIARITDKGTLRALQWLRSMYSLRQIKKIVEKSKNVSTQTKNYWHHVYYA